MSEVGLAMAFLGGLLALLSPCSALLLPAFFAYSFTSRTKLVARTGLFYVGLCTTLVPLGVAGSFASRLFYGHLDTLVAVGGWTVIALGVAQIAGLGFGSRRMAQAAGARRSGSALSVFAFGAVHGLAGFCAGPILGGILTVAAVGGDPLHGGALLAVCALGMALPMFALALLSVGPVRSGPQKMAARTAPSGGAVVSAQYVGARRAGLRGARLAVSALRRDVALPSLISTDTELALEERLSGIGAVVSDRLVLLVLAAGVMVAALYVLLRPVRKRRRDVEEREPSAQR